MANIITSIRILCSLALLFCPVFSPAFYALYLTAGVTDMTDGTVARKTNTVSQFGAGLDTAADFVFVVVCLIKLLPAVEIPVWVCIWTAIIALIKGSGIVACCVLRKSPAVLHTVMNKITGALLFLLPLTLSWIDLRWSAPVVCTAATAAAIQDLHCIRTGRGPGRARENAADTGGR